MSVCASYFQNSSTFLERRDGKSTESPAPAQIPTTLEMVKSGPKLLHRQYQGSNPTAVNRAIKLPSWFTQPENLDKWDPGTVKIEGSQIYHLG